MRILVAVDKFAGTLSAPAAATAIAAGWAAVRPGDRIDLLGMSDGGPGFLDCLQGAGIGEAVEVEVSGPYGAPVAASFLLAGGDAFVESAAACGRHLAAGPPRAAAATTRGVGEMVRAAVDAGATRVTVGLGGSATTDGGAGALSALGVRAWSRTGPLALDVGGGVLKAVAKVDLTSALALIGGLDRFVVACDISSGLLGPLGAARCYASQKGADDAEVEVLETALTRWARVCAEAGAEVGPTAAGAGAAGGLGFGLLALGADYMAGLDVVSAVVGLGRRCAAADLVITGEGALDSQTAAGKVVAGVAAAGARQHRPVAAVVGRCELSPAEVAELGLRRVASSQDAAGSAQAALADPAVFVAAAAARLASETDRWL